VKAEYINPFISAAFNVFQMMVGVTPEKGQLSARKGIFTSQQCNIVLGVTGQLEGQIIIGMSIFTADKIASKMLGTTIRTFDELAASAIAELGNMISGAALTELASKGHPVQPVAAQPHSRHECAHQHAGNPDAGRTPPDRDGRHRDQCRADGTREMTASSGGKSKAVARQ
jgi:chemotaxis protein CheX